jgi:hypothetical protein
MVLHFMKKISFKELNVVSIFVHIFFNSHENCDWQLPSLSEQYCKISCNTLIYPVLGREKQNSMVTASHHCFHHGFIKVYICLWIHCLLNFILIRSFHVVKMLIVVFWVVTPYMSSTLNWRWRRYIPPNIRNHLQDYTMPQSTLS